jgi:hypothetical protein
MSALPIGGRFAAFASRFAIAILFVLAFSSAGHAQSTFGSVLGTVKDPSGSFVPKAKIELLNTGTSAIRSTESDANGDYKFVNIDVGNYKLSVEAPGFQRTEFQPFDLSARETKRVDADLKVASQVATVTVESTAVLQTDVSNVAESMGSLELTDLPAAITTRASGSTSAFSTLTGQPGVQTDASNNISVAGTQPGQLSFSIDGISSVGPGALGALAELFPSFNAIEEIRISENLNPAEFGGVADVTTISKSGTNVFHGGLFENVQNTSFNAADTFSHAVTIVKLNNFGAFLGGPVILPKLYNGRNKTFFFGSYEVLRLPKQQTQILSVPTQAMRNGDLSAYLDPANGGAINQLAGFTGNQIPTAQLNPFTQAILKNFYPLPNSGPAGAISNNYVATYAVPINSAQGDIRVDQIITPKHSVYARYSYKNRRVTDVHRDFPFGGGQGGNPSSPLVGDTSKPEIYNALAVAHTWIVSSAVVNEARFGFSKTRRGYSFPFTSQKSAALLGLTAPPLPSISPGDNIPAVTIAGFLGIDTATADIHPREATTQFLDTLTWTKSKHTLKFGADFRYLSALFTSVFQDYRMGNYTFNGATTQPLLATPPPPGTVPGVLPMAGLLLGIPDSTTIGSVLNPSTDSYSKHYAFFGQDDYKISRSLTINFGLRWEYHPMFRDHNNNLANFDPDFVSTQNGQQVRGAVILPGQSTFALVNPFFAQSIAPMPIITAAQAGIPSTLRFSEKTDFAPRIGFAYRLGNKTVIRGGYGRFIQTLLTSGVVDGWAVEASSVTNWTNSFTGGTPLFTAPYSFPSNLSQPGTQQFDLAVNTHYKDPKVDEWNLTLERDLGKGVGLRLSYDGNHAYNLGTLLNGDQVPVNKVGFNPANLPFPQLSYIDLQTNLGYANYNAGTISVRKRSSNLQFESSYTFTRNLTNIYGATSSGAAGFGIVNEFGGNLSDPLHPGLDYGNTPYSRRHRFLTTFLYELPFGRGKAFLNSSNPVVDRIIGGWVTTGIVMVQSGPFLTVGLSGLSDPSGTGYNLFGFNPFGRPDIVPGVDPYKGQSLSQWINPAAFVDPGSNIGRFGNAAEGSVVGPGTKAVGLALLKRIRLTESVRLEIGAQVSNLFNHPNYNPPNLQVGVAGFGQLNSLQSAEGSGPRAMQLTGRLNF